MPRMFRVLAFWTAITGVMSMIGDLWPMALIFYGQTIFFLAVSYLNLSERMYMYIFGAYLTVFFIGFTYWTNFMMVPGSGGQ